MPFLGDFFLTKKGFATFRELINFIEITEILILLKLLFGQDHLNIQY